MKCYLRCPPLYPFPLEKKVSRQWRKKKKKKRERKERRRPNGGNWWVDAGKQHCHGNNGV